MNRFGSRRPDYRNLLAVLERRTPERPTLFEFFLNDALYARLAQEDGPPADREDFFRRAIRAYERAGYDYTTVTACELSFPAQRHNGGKQTISLNDGAIITDRESFRRYPWPDPDSYDYGRLDRLSAFLPEGMKLVVWGSGGGVLEIVIELVGFDRLCYMLADDPLLAADIFDAVGSRLVRYYERCGAYDAVCAMISNDDWGFNTQTMLSPDDMRKYVFPWHRRIVQAIHGSGRPAILHSCGQLELVMEDVIGDMRYDAKHSYEDVILPVEQAYERWGGRIAVLGGIDVDFLCRETPEAIRTRSRAMLERCAKRGAYALGSGNSIPAYIPDESYFAMISAATE